jgi:hypothetical protein
MDTLKDGIVRVVLRIRIFIILGRGIRIRIRVNIQELGRLKMVSWRAVHTHVGGLEAQNGAVESWKLYRLIRITFQNPDLHRSEKSDTLSGGVEGL